MLKLNARLIGVYKANDYKNKNTGKETIGKTKLQLQTTIKMKDGSDRVELMDISIPPEKVSSYRSKVGQDVSVDVAIVSKEYYLYGI